MAVAEVRGFSMGNESPLEKQVNRSDADEQLECPKEESKVDRNDGWDANQNKIHSID